MMLKSKRGQVIGASIIWFFVTFFYFIIGFHIISLIVDTIFLDTATGLLYYFGSIIPFIPIFGLMFWGYTILNPEPVDIGGFNE